MKECSVNQLQSLYGGGQKEADVFLSAFYGAAQGMAFCYQAIPIMTPQIYAACAAAGAAKSVFFPS